MPDGRGSNARPSRLTSPPLWGSLGLTLGLLATFSTPWLDGWIGAVLAVLLVVGLIVAVVREFAADVMSRWENRDR